MGSGNKFLYRSREINICLKIVMRLLAYLYQFLGILLKVVLVLLAIVVVALVATLLIDNSLNTLPITNYCFAILAGISSVCFLGRETSMTKSQS